MSPLGGYCPLLIEILSQCKYQRAEIRVESQVSRVPRRTISAGTIHLDSD